VAPPGVKCHCVDRCVVTHLWNSFNAMGIYNGDIEGILIITICIRFGRVEYDMLITTHLQKADIVL
jgi:hypothetical protein